MYQRGEISKAFEDCWKWNDFLMVILAGDQLRFYIWKKSAKRQRTPFQTNPPTNNVKLT